MEFPRVMLTRTWRAKKLRAELLPARFELGRRERIVAVGVGPPNDMQHQFVRRKPFIAILIEIGKRGVFRRRNMLEGPTLRLAMRPTRLKRA
jgi:hypothetical protein